MDYRIIMECSCKWIIKECERLISLDNPPDEEIVFTINEHCNKHKHFLKLKHRMPGFTTNQLDALVFRQLEFPAYFAEMELKYCKYRSRLEMVMEKL